MVFSSHEISARMGKHCQEQLKLFYYNARPMQTNI